MKRMNIALALALAASTASAQHEGHGGALQPTDAGQSASATAGHGSHGAAEDAPGTTPRDQTEISVSADRQQLIGVKTAKVERGKLTETVRANAIVQTDETREAHVHTKLMGWVQELFANSVGQKVKKGDPLYSLYSQELFAAEQEYLRARKSAPDLAQMAKQRMLLWDVPADQLKKIETAGPQKAVVFRSPLEGTVVEKLVLKGHYVEPGAMLYRIADLSRVWIIANVYEYEVNRIALGGVGRVTVQGLSAPIEAKVDYIYPTVDAVTRTVKVRLTAPNPTGALRPNTFGIAELPSLPSVALYVPEAALIDTGTRQVVFVALGEGRFRPVTVKVGRRAEGRIEILAGVSEGQSVVTGANFLLDSESRLKANPAGHGGHGG